MRHVVLTRSSYGPEWSLAANRRRLAILKGITAATMRAQTRKDWTWIGLLDERDPYREERAAVFDQTFTWDPSSLELQFADWGQDTGALNGLRDKVAATAYRAPWPVGSREEPLLMTRLDDDDGFAPDAMARLRAAVGSDASERRVFTFPYGVYVDGDEWARPVKPDNAWQSLLTPAGDTMTVYDYPHGRPVVTPTVIDDKPGWLWARHGDTLSRTFAILRPLTDAARAQWPINWDLLRARLRPAKVFWCDRCGSGSNFGDQLGPVLLRQYGRVALLSEPAHAEFVTVGSILGRCSGTRATVLGSGFIAAGESADLSQARLAFVRGALTRDAAGAPKDTPLGDPGILVALDTDTTHIPRSGLVAVPHHVDQTLSAERRVNILDPIPTVIAQIATAERIVTSSLHAMVVADALGIEHKVTLHPKVHGGAFKFADYTSAFGLPFEPDQWRLTPRAAMDARVRELDDLMEQVRPEPGAPVASRSYADPPPASAGAGARLAWHRAQRRRARTGA